MEIIGPRGNKIDSIVNWYDTCSPAGGKKQWKKYRSAKELAEFILNNDSTRRIQKFLSGKYSGIQLLECYPEWKTAFDQYSNRRHHDLVILAKNNIENILITVEAKADESFGQTIHGTRKKSLSNVRSKIPERIEGLKRAILPRANIDTLRYQLFTIVAGTIVEAGIQGSKNALALVLVFKSKYLRETNMRRNNKDLNIFIECLSGGRDNAIEDNQIVGPYRVSGNEYINSDIDLSIGKMIVDID